MTSCPQIVNINHFVMIWVNNGNGWLAVFFARVRFTVMKCPVKLRSVKLGLFLAAPLSEAARWVRCRGCRCLAIVDKNGKWRCFATGEELKVKCVEATGFINRAKSASSASGLF
jgi:hypothetical protein